MIQNLWWAAGYNIITIPLAAGILAPYGIILSPAIGAVFDEFEYGHRRYQCENIKNLIEVCIFYLFVYEHTLSHFMS